MNFLVLFTIVLLIIAGHQLLRVIELSRGLKKTKEWQITDTDNNMMGKAMLIFMFLFFGFFIWQAARWNERVLPGAASVHGEKIDTLWDWNMYLCTFVFFVTNFFLFYFAYKYRGNKKTQATYFPHDNRLEMAWTIVPAIVLAFVIIFGLKYWNEITDEAKSANKITIELYAKQFAWTARYTGKDGKLGQTDYRQIGGSNSVGMDTSDIKGFDDMIVNNEFHIPVGREIEFFMRSRDVLHSAYMPHFRAQMNCVPGMVTTFKFIPTKTTAQMRKDPYVVKMIANINKVRLAKNKEPIEFDYLLMCNKICGQSHYNMQMSLIVDTEADYNAWIAKQKAFKIVTPKNIALK